MGFGAFVEGKSLIRPTEGLGSCCKVVGENTEVGGSCKDKVLDGCALSTESTSLSDATSLSHSSNRTRFVGLDDWASSSNGRLSPIIGVRALGRG